MALIHTEADLVPDKLELLAAWLPHQPWGSPGEVTRVATYRFDDLADEVGMETLLVAVDDALLQIPLTYRGGPLAGGTLVGSMEHSALGHRWVYDATTDPVYLDTIRRVILDGGHEAEQFAADGTRLPRTATSAAVVGAATDAAVAPTATVEVLRRPLVTELANDTAVVGTITGTWQGQVDPVVLVRLLRS